MEEIYGNSIDKPSPSDHIAEHILGVDTTKVLPEEVLMATEAGNQGSVPMCTTMGNCHVSKILNEIEHHIKITPAYAKEWDLQGEFGTRVEGGGDFVQTALKNIVKNGLITEDGHVYPISGYARIQKDEINYWLSLGFPIVTSTMVTKTNYKNAKSTGYWTGNDGNRTGGHCIALNGYTPTAKVALNSYGPKWGFFKDGTFRIKNELAGDLGTCYIIYDQKDVEQAAFIFKDVTSLSPYQDAIFEMKKLGIMNGYEDGRFRPEQPVTRAELSQVLYNMVKNGYIIIPK